MIDRDVALDHICESSVSDEPTDLGAATLTKCKNELLGEFMVYIGPNEQYGLITA